MFLNDFKEKYKQSEIKQLLRFTVDFIEKSTEFSEDFLEETLANQYKLNKSLIDYFQSYKTFQLVKIEKLKLSNLEKKFKNRIGDFSYKFYVKYADCLSDKVEFRIKLNFVYLNDNFESETVEFEMTIHQFYGLLNDFQKIDTMVKTLI